MMFWFLLGCVNSVTQLVEISLVLELEAAEGLEGPVTGELLHTWSGEGELRVPLIPFESFEAEGPGSLSLTARVPVEEGEGLSVYGWLDLDGDGLLCALGVEDEPAGLAQVEPFPATSGEATVVLDAPCAGPEALFP